MFDIKKSGRRPDHATSIILFFLSNSCKQKNPKLFIFNMTKLFKLQAIILV